MTNNIQKWERDPLFSAAEIVQDSADRMETIYRVLLHEQSLVGAEPADTKLQSSIKFHRRDLITAVGITKWQLEDFERAVNALGVSEKAAFKRDAMLRYGQFVRAIREQIALVEKSLNHPPAGEGNCNNQLVNLNEQDSEQLALFLSGVYASDSISYGIDTNNLRASGDDPSASGLDDGSNEIIELKIDGTPNGEGNVHVQTNSFRHSNYGIQSKSAPDLNYLNQCHLNTFFHTSALSSDDMIDRRNWQENGFHKGANGQTNCEDNYIISRSWDVELPDDNTNKKKMKSSQSRGYLWGLLRYTGSAIESKMSRSFTKRRKDGEICEDYLLDAGQIPPFSNVGSHFEPLGHSWPCLTSSLEYSQIPFLVGSFRRKLQRIHNFIQYRQFWLRTTSVVLITLGIVGLVALEII